MPLRARAAASPPTILTHPWPDPANPYTLRLGEALAARGVDVVPARYLAAHCARPRGARWLHLHWPEWMTASPSRARYLAGIAYQGALLALARAQGVSLAWTAHNLLGHDDPHPDLGARARRALLARCSVVIGHFPGAEADLRAMGFRGRFAWHPHPHFDRDYPAPFRDAAAREDFRRALGVGEGELLLVSAGAIEGYKNLPALASALSALAPPRVRWLVAGRVGSESAWRELVARCGSAPWCTLRPGFVAADEMARLVAAADASMLAYRAFYTSGAAVLSLTLGTPVVGPPRHHLATWQGEDFFVPLHDVTPAALAAALDALRAMPAGARARGRARALEATWEGAAAVVGEALLGGIPLRGRGESS